jgi:lipopolysaccharide biosynthesis glycosyltransferase
MDNDSICISEFNITELVKIFEDGIVKLMGVHSPRPNLERYSVLRLKSPFQYFNAGILIGLKDNSYSINNISRTIKLLRSLDPLDLIWHDQDIFNYLFNEKVYLLDPTYNFSTGYMNKEFRVFNLLNDQFMNILRKKIKIIHFSGNFILNKKYHPYMEIYYQKLNELKKILIKSSINEKILLQYLKQIELILNSKHFKRLDHLLQIFYIRRRFFSNDYYPSIKSLVKNTLKNV